MGIAEEAALASGLELVIPYWCTAGRGTVQDCSRLEKQLGEAALVQSISLLWLRSTTQESNQ
jgi:hypothetical protein